MAGSYEQTVSLADNQAVLLPGGGTVKATPMGCSTMQIEVEVTGPDGDTVQYRLNRGAWQEVGNDVQLQFVAGYRIKIKNRV